MTTPHKLNTKIGEHEFNAEGREEVVLKLYEMWLEAIAGQRGPGKPAPGKDEQPPDKAGSPNLSAIFRKDDDSIVSLLVLPPDTADAVLLLMYGFQVVGEEDPVTVTRLMKGVKQSGIKTDRVDRALSAHADKYQKGGVRRAGKYRLNNVGVSYAMGVLKQMEAG